MGAREEALAVLDSFNTTPTSIISYQSNGRVIVFGDETALKLCNDFAEPLKLTRIAMSASAKKVASDVIVLNQRAIDIQGHLGNFVVRLIGADYIVETLKADIILDLNPRPLITLEIPPPGYLHESFADQTST